MARRAFAIWVPGTLRWPSRAAMETFLKVHGLRLSPPRGHQRLERHATRLVALGNKSLLNYVYPGGRRVFSTRTLTSVLVSLSHPPGTFSAALNSARRFVDGDGHHLVSPLALFQFSS